jgi:hypothetical protein
VPPYFSVKEAVFPFIKFPGVDTILGPEMKSTGEVMGVGETFAEAFVKSQLAAGWPPAHRRHAIKNGEIQLVFTTVDETRTAIADSRSIRTAALANRVTYYTTMAGCEAAVEA